MQGTFLSPSVILVMAEDSLKAGLHTPETTRNRYVVHALACLPYQVAAMMTIADPMGVGTFIDMKQVMRHFL